MNAETLKKLLKEINDSFVNSIITPKEIEKILSGIVSILSEFKKSTNDLNAETKTVIASILDEVEQKKALFFSDAEKSTTKAILFLDSEIQKAIAEIKILGKEIKANPPKAGDPGAPGKDADEETIIEKVLALLPKYEPTISETGESIVLKINELDINPEFQIDASHIKNLPKRERLIATGNRLLSTLVDVNLTGLTNGQTIVWDATNQYWKPGTSTGSSIALKTNGTANGSQSILNLKQGTNVTITDDGVGGITIASTGDGVSSVNTATGAVTLTVANTGSTLAYDATTKTQLNIPTATTSITGLLSSTDWTTFNGKQSALTFGNLTDPGTDGITIGNGTGSVIGTGTTISQRVADTSHNGYLSSTDWNTFNGKGSGTVTAVSVATANGFAGTSSGGATPALTLTTTITGLLKGNGTAISAATAGTDYVVPTGFVQNVAVTITQTAHGFVVGQPLRFNGTSYVKSQADTSGDAEVEGLVMTVINANSFVFVQSSGFVSSVDTTVFNTMTAGTTYFLSQTTAGTFTATAPVTIGQISKPIFRATAAQAGYFINYRGLTVSATAVTGAGGSNTQVQYNNSGAFAGSANLIWDNTNVQLQIGGTSGFSATTNTPISLAGTVNTYFQTYTQNKSNGTSASTDDIQGADNDGVALVGHYIDKGINSSGWTKAANPTFNAQSANDGYLNTSGGNMWFGTDQIFIGITAGGFASTNEVSRFTTTGQTLGLTGTLTGALKFAGATSTFITLQGQAVGGSNVLTLPGITSTLAAIAFVFGSGSDGALSISSGTTTLTRDMYYTNLTISSTGKLNTAGYKIYVSGILDLTAAGAGAIQNNASAGTNGGVSAGGGGAASVTGANGTTTLPFGPGGSTGGAGTTTIGGTPSNGTGANVGQGGPSGNGGNGGTGSSGAGGTGGSSVNASGGVPFIRFAVDLNRGTGGTGSPASFNGGSGGSGGGGGGGDGSLGAGAGGGGGGGQTMYIAAQNVKTNGAAASAIQCQGGAGGNGANIAAGSRGGGGGAGGGGGGWIYFLYGNKLDAAATNLFDVSGGQGGSGGNGTNASGGAGGGAGGGGGRITLFNMVTATGSETTGLSVQTANAGSGMTGGGVKAGQVTQVTF